MSVASIIAQVESICETEMNRIAHQIEGELKAAANKDTGRMAGSITAQPTGDMSYFIGTSITNDKGFPYPVVANDGRGAVRPVRAKMLRYKDGTFHKYSRPYGGSHFVERVASRWK